MRNSIVGVIIGVIILFLSLIVLPTYYISIVNWRDDMNTCQTAARNFVDMVIDNGQITDKALSDLNLSLAGCTGTFTYEYYKEEKTTNPAVVMINGVETMGSETTWNVVEVNDETIWREGDLITIVIHQNGLNLYQRLSSAILGSSFTTVEIRLSGMVR